MAGIKEVKEIPLDDLVIGKGQVRLRDTAKGIDELADSIRKVGLLEPVVVCSAEVEGKYEIILGQRRFLACQELKKSTILAAVIDGHVEEIDAKILSLTENLIRQDLNTRDLIDVVNELYNKYGSIQAVVEETALPRSKVSKFVKYPRLVPELKALVDSREVKIDTALRAQEAAEVAGDVDPTEAVELAKEMSAMSGAQQRKIVKDRQDNPSSPVDEIIEHSKSGGKITQVIVTLTDNIHRSLNSYADFEDRTLDDAAAMLIEEGLSQKGFLES